MACAPSDKKGAGPWMGGSVDTAAAEPSDTDPAGGQGSDPPDTSDSADTADSGVPADTADPADTGDTDGPPELHGEILDPPTSLPDFTLVDQHGITHTPSDLLGAPTVVWFFRDTASSCTNDACGYRDMQPAFDDIGVRIVGVGPTSVEDNAAWAAALDYQYQIWSDPEAVLGAAYGTESPFDEGNLRHAFVLDADGLAILRYEGAVSVGADPSQVLADCQALFGE